jgi:hypothetical protein
MGRLPRLTLTLPDVGLMQYAVIVVHHWHTCPNCGPRWLPYRPHIPQGRDDR